MKPRTEADLQVAIVTLAKLMAIDRALPERRVKLLKLYHIPNGVKPQGKKGSFEWLADAEGNWRRTIVHDPGTGKSEAARLGALEKALGVRRGMPDLHLPVRGVWYDGNVTTYKTADISLYGEVKLPKVKVLEYQRVIHEELRAEGNRVDIWRSVDDAMRSFKEHLAL